MEPRFAVLGVLSWCCAVVGIVATTRRDWTTFSLVEVENGQEVENKYRLGLWRGKKVGEDDDDFVVNRSDNGIDDGWYWNPATVNRAASLVSIFLCFLVGFVYVLLTLSPRVTALEWICGLFMVGAGVFDWVALARFVDKVDNEYQRQTEVISEVRTCATACQLQLGVSFAVFSLGILLLSVANNVPFLAFCGVKENNPDMADDDDDDDDDMEDPKSKELEMTSAESLGSKPAESMADDPDSYIHPS